MKVSFAEMVAAVALLFAVVTSAAGQEAAPINAYAGPTYPGGPDSLRALVYRSTRQLSPSLAGRSVIQYELKGGQEPTNFKLVGPLRSAKSDLGNATQVAMQYLQAQMLSWQPGPPNPDAKPGKNPRGYLALNFAAIPNAQPYAYVDQEPQFSYLTDMLNAQHNRNFQNNPDGAAILAKMVSSYSSLRDYVQRQTRYPPEALRNQQEGQVKVYFEVSESGAIENPEIVGSVSGALDAEVLRAVKTLRPASKPAMLNGKPVRMFYVFPLNFKIQ